MNLKVDIQENKDGSANITLDIDTNSYNILVAIANKKSITIEKLINQIIKNYITDTHIYNKDILL